MPTQAMCSLLCLSVVFILQPVSLQQLLPLAFYSFACFFNLFLNIWPKKKEMAGTFRLLTFRFIVDNKLFSIWMVHEVSIVARWMKLLALPHLIDSVKGFLPCWRITDGGSNAEQCVPLNKASSANGRIKNRVQYLWIAAEPDVQASE